MNVVTQVFALVAALIHVAIFAMESLLFTRPSVRQTFGGRAGIPPEVDLWAFNQGFYNLFLAAGPIAGVIAYHAGHRATGEALTLYACAFMVAAGAVLVLSQRRLWRGALLQALPPLVALIAAAF